MTATLLATKRVEKPWGRHTLWPGFSDPAPGGDPVGEVWFQTPDAGTPDLLIKYLFTSERLSVQDHPDDEAARAAGYPRGKDECWVILDAEPGATIALGTKEPTTREKLRHAPGARRRAAVHRLDADTPRLERANQRHGRPNQRRAGSQQQEFGTRVERQHQFEIALFERRERWRRPAIGALGRDRQRVIDIVVDAKAGRAQSRDDRPVATGAVHPHQLLPGPTRSAPVAALGLPGLSGVGSARRPSVMSSDDDT